LIFLQATLDGNEFLCSTSGGSYSDGAESGRRSKRSAEEVSTYEGQLPANRTLYINCTQPEVQCLVVECLVGPLRGPNSPAVITYQLKADIKKLGKFEHARVMTQKIVRLVKIFMFFEMSLKRIKLGDLHDCNNKSDYNNVLYCWATMDLGNSNKWT